ncbi:MAG: aminotransferase class III-fold pyridoxal phosphate-dependent enzyme, partial [Clostridia bacterium]
MNLEQIIEMDQKYYVNTFGNRVPVCFESGHGLTLTSTDGKEYIDLFAGVAVSALGHSHLALVKAITDQAAKLLHCSNYYYIENQSKLAKLLVANSFADKVFFTNSGAEANEAALKLARGYFSKRGQAEKCEFISLHNSFHGRTLATVAATGTEKYQAPFAPMPAGLKKVEANNFEQLAAAAGPSVCAILLEPIMGEGGVIPLTTTYLQQVRKLCDERDILLILDEVQTGLGRTGTLFAYESHGIVPDTMSLAKALGGGFPIGAMLASDKA